MSALWQKLVAAKVPVVALLLLAFAGTPIFVAMAAFALYGEVQLHPDMSTPQAFSVCVAHVFEALAGATASTLATLPLFVFLGYIMAHSKTAERLVNAANAWLGWAPGGLAIVTVFTCAFFTTVTGASGITIVAIGGLIMPSLLKQKYGERFSLGLVTGTGSIGLMFPPALPIIVYGIVYGVTLQGMSDEGAGAAMGLADFEVTAFLVSGVFPGFVLIFAACAYAVVVAIYKKVPRFAFKAEGLGDATLKAVPELVLPILLIVTIATGVLQIPEAAAFAALYVLVVEVFLFKDVKLRDLWKIAREAMAMVGAIFIIIVAATAVTQYFLDADVPGWLFTQMSKYITNKWTFLLALNALLLVVGCLMDIFSAIVVVVPLIAPAAKHYGIDPYHLGVVFLLNLEIGYLTPPFGLNLFISSLRFKKPILSVVRSVLPFILVMLVALLIVSYVPLLFPSTGKLLRLGVSKPPASMDDGPATAVGAEDGGIANVKITWPDGGVWTAERCETPEIKDDALAYAECTAMFKLYPQCDKLTEELAKLECRDLVMSGENPFEADAGGDETADAGVPDAAR